MLQHNAQPAAALVSQLDNLAGPLQGYVQGLFQKHMPSACKAGLGQLQMRGGGRGNDHGLHKRVIQYPLKV